MADSLSGLEVEALREARRAADLGAGAGFPGLVLAAALPEARVDLIESSAARAPWSTASSPPRGITNATTVRRARRRNGERGLRAAAGATKR